MKRTTFKKILAAIICVSVLLTSLVSVFPAFAADSDPIIVISGSDFQNSSDNTDAEKTKYVDNIVAKMKEDYGTIDGFIFAGDYTIESDLTEEDTEDGIRLLTNAVSELSPTNTILIQGNHDPYSLVEDGTLAPNGENDTANYGVFVINEEKYAYHGTDSKPVEEIAAELEEYLDEKLTEKYTKPIFIVSHVPLHYTVRTYKNGDGMYANYLFDLINEAGAAGLNIIFMFGHDHANGYDDYLGGDSIYLAKGDNINIAQASKEDYETETLNFTYLNAGYTAYYLYGEETTSYGKQTMVAYEITEDDVTIHRYYYNGYGEATTGDLKKAGTDGYPSTSDYDAICPEIDSKVYASGQKVTLNKEFDTTASDSVNLSVNFLLRDKLGYSFYPTGSGLSNYDKVEVEVTYNHYGQGVTDGASLKAVTALEDGKSYVIVNNATGTAIDSNLITNSAGQYVLTMTEATADATTWLFNGSGTSYKIQNAEGYCIKPNNPNVTLDTTTFAATVEYNAEAGGWNISRTSSSSSTVYYLQTYQESADVYYTYGKSESDAASDACLWTIYEVETSEPEAVNYKRITKTLKYDFTEGGIAEYTEIAAYEMMLDTTFTLKCYEGEEVAVEKSATITFADHVKRALASAEDKTVYVDILNYGAAAQDYFASKNEGSDLAADTAELGLPNADIADYQQYATSDDVASADNASRDANTSTSNGARLGATLQILSSNRLVFVVDAGEYEVANLKLVVGEKEIAVADLELNGSYYYYYPAEEDAIALYDAKKVLSAELYNGEEVVATKTYSIEAFVAANMRDNGKLEALGDALLKLSASTRAVLGLDGSESALQAVTSIETGKNYVVVNKATGTVLTNTIESGSHWYADLGTQAHVLLGSEPTADSETWSFVTYNDGYAMAFPAEIGGYLSPNTVNVHNSGMYEWISPLYVVYDSTQAAFQIYANPAEDTTYKLVACNSLNEDGTSTGKYVYAIGCYNSDFDAYSYWEIYEVVEGVAPNTPEVPDNLIQPEPVDPDQPGTDEPTDPEDPDEPVDPDEPTTEPTLVEVTPDTIIKEGSADYIIVNNKTGLVLGTSLVQNSSSQDVIALSGTPTVDSGAWTFTYHSDMKYALTTETVTANMSPNKYNVATGQKSSNLFAYVEEGTEGAQGSGWLISRDDNKYCLQAYATNDVYDLAYGLYPNGSSEDTAITAYSEYCYWTIYEVVGGTTQPEDPDQPGTDEPTDPEDPDEPVDPDQPVDPEDPEEPTTSLKAVTSIETGKNYVVVNKTTGTVLTNTIETGSYWYSGLGEQQRVLLGGEPTVDSETWSFETYDDGYAMAFPAEIGGYLSPNSVNVHNSTMKEWIKPLHVEYNETQAAFQIYANPAEDTTYKLVACNSLNEDGTSTGKYVYAIGCYNSDFDAYSYWEIYEIVEGGTNTDPDQPGTDEPTDPEDPDEPVDPDQPTTEPTLVEVTPDTIIKEGSADYIIVNNKTGLVLGTSLVQNSSSQDVIALSGEPTVDSGAWTFTYHGDMQYALTTETVTANMSPNNLNVASGQKEYNLFAYVEEGTEGAQGSGWLISRNDNKYCLQAYATNGVYDQAYGLFPNGSSQDSTTAAYSEYCYWTIYEVVGGTTQPENPDQPGTDEPTDPEDPEDPVDPNPEDSNYELQLVTEVEDGESYVIVNMHTGNVLSNTVQTSNYWYLTSKNNVLTDKAPSVNSPTWTLEKSGDSYKMYYMDGTSKKYLAVYTLEIAIQSSAYASELTFANTDDSFLIYVTGKDYYLTTYKDNNGVLNSSAGSDSLATASGNGQPWWQLYKVVEKGSSSEGGADDDVEPETPEDVVAKDNDNDGTPNFSYVFATDVHIGNGSSATTNAIAMYQDIATLVENGTEVDTVLISGDLTQLGYRSEYMTLLSIINRYSVDGITTYTTMGNHDVRSYDFESSTRTDDERWAEMWGYYTEFMEETTNIVLEVPYYHVEIAGHNGTVYDLVVLCTETPEKDNINMSEAQLAWFEATLDEIEAEKGTDQNILVMCHQPLSGTFTNTNCYDQYNAEVKSIIAEHPQVIYMSGHLHTGPQVYETDGAGTYLDGESTWESTKYFFVEAYDGYFIVKVRDFSTGEWTSETRIDF